MGLRHRGNQFLKTLKIAKRCIKASYRWIRKRDMVNSFNINSIIKVVPHEYARVEKTRPTISSMMVVPK